jgi:ubiquinone/menaquinone biosynthesis C-methylase UbiE
MPASDPPRRSPPDVAAVREYWNRHAARYEGVLSRLLDRVLLGRARARIASRAVGPTLEVAIGTGRNLPWYPRHVPLTGIELSPAMLAVARRRAVELGRHVDLREGDARALPFGPEEFDTVVCTLALCSIPDQARAVAEMYRVLRPGGRLFLLDHVTPQNTAVRLALQTAWRAATAVAGRRHASHGDGHMGRTLPVQAVADCGFVIREQSFSWGGIIHHVEAEKPR